MRRSRPDSFSQCEFAQMIGVKVKGVTEWNLEEKELYDLEEISPELAWNSGGVAIRGARGKEGLTQKQLAELTGIAQHHISEMENGKRPIGKETARKLGGNLGGQGEPWGSGSTFKHFRSNPSDFGHQSGGTGNSGDIHT